MTAPEFEARIVSWASEQPDVEAVVQIGSRVQHGAVVDSWSDWDYHLVVRQPKLYQNRVWPETIAPCWSVHFQRTERGVTKLSAVFAGGGEADFVLLSSWQLKLVCQAMRYPAAQTWFPTALREGINNFRLVVAPGYRVIWGGPKWERRYASVATPWPELLFSMEDFHAHIAAFWRHAVWVAKKILRGEIRAAVRWSHVELRDHIYALLAEEARIEGRAPRPEARQAERWLNETRLEQTALFAATSQRQLAELLLKDINLVRELTQKISNGRGFVAPDYSDLESWLRTELSTLRH